MRTESEGLRVLEKDAAQANGMLTPAWVAECASDLRTVESSFDNARATELLVEIEGVGFPWGVAAGLP